MYQYSTAYAEIEEMVVMGLAVVHDHPWSYGQTTFVVDTLVLFCICALHMAVSFMSAVALSAPRSAKEQIARNVSYSQILRTVFKRKDTLACPKNHIVQGKFDLTKNKEDKLTNVDNNLPTARDSTMDQQSNSSLPSPVFHGPPIQPLTTWILCLCLIRFNMLQPICPSGFPDPAVIAERNHCVLICVYE